MKKLTVNLLETRGRMVKASRPVTKGLTVVLARNSEEVHALFTMAVTMPRSEDSDMHPVCSRAGP